MSNRRHFLTAAALLAAGFGYSYQRGLRYPRLSFEPRDVSNLVDQDQAHLELVNLIHLPDEDSIALRAIAPSPQLMVTLNSAEVEITVNNVITGANLVIAPDTKATVDELVDGISRTIMIRGHAGQQVNLHWQSNLDEGFDFAVIGDTGGGEELDWCLQRAAALGAQFLLHLGDFNYTDGEYTRAISQFQQAPLPCYITIGNHDFNDSGLVYQRFLRNLGPLNNWFEVAGTRFINIDTAADFFPAQAGLRGKLLSNLTQQPWQGDNTIMYTHSPLRDPRPLDDHEVGGINEVEWLSQMANRLDAKNLLCGHVHHSAELDINGIHQWTVGEGLGHEDLIHQRLVAQLLIARVEPGRPVNYRWQDLAMPMSYHTSPTHAFKLRRDGRDTQYQWYQSLFDQPQPS